MFRHNALAKALRPQRLAVNLAGFASLREALLRTVVIFAMLAALAHAAGDGNIDRATLRGIAGFSVVIDHLDPQLPREGVTSTALQYRLERKLREADIPVDPQSNVFVGIQATAVRAGKGQYAGGIL